jgi:hypothetical protein
MSAIISKTGFGPWGKQLVTVNGETHAFSKSADVKVGPGGVCVTESRLFSSEMVCFPTGPGSVKGADGSAKTITVTKTDGSSQRYDSSALGVYRTEQRGNEVAVVQATPAGDRTVAKLHAASVKAIEKTGCGICETLNPLYRTSK